MVFAVNSVSVNINPQKDSFLRRQTESIMDVDRASYKTTEFFAKTLSPKCHHKFRFCANRAQIYIIFMLNIAVFKKISGLHRIQCTLPIRRQLLYDYENRYLLLLLERFLDRSYKYMTVCVCREHTPTLIKL
jgi:hypothetical protein